MLCAAHDLSGSVSGWVSRHNVSAPRDDESPLRACTCSGLRAGRAQAGSAQAGGGPLPSTILPFASLRFCSARLGRSSAGEPFRWASSAMRSSISCTKSSSSLVLFAIFSPPTAIDDDGRTTLAGSVPSTCPSRYPTFASICRRNYPTAAKAADVGSAGVLARQHLGQALVEQRDRLIHVGFIDHQRRHEANRALTA